MRLHFEIVAAGVWQCTERTDIQVRNMPRTRLGRNGFAVGGWAVFVGGREVLTCGRSETKRDACVAAQAYADRDEAASAARAAEAENFATVQEIEERQHPQARVASALAKLTAAVREQALAELPPAPASADPATDDDVSELVDRIVRRAQYEAFRAVRRALAGWVEGARENHEAMGHRGENTGAECWTQFAPEDIANMINDAATELRIPKPVEQ